MILIPNKCRFIGINISTKVPSIHLLQLILLDKVRKFCLEKKASKVLTMYNLHYYWLMEKFVIFYFKSYHFSAT